MDRSAIAARPMSYSKACPTFRTAVGNLPTARASLGCVVFVDLNKDDTGLAALVFQHRLEHRPPCIQGGLPVAHLDHLGR